MLDYAQRITPSNDSCKQCVCLKPWIREGKALLTKHTAHYKKKSSALLYLKQAQALAKNTTELAHCRWSWDALSQNIWENPTEIQTSHMAPTSMCRRQNSWPWPGFWERGHCIVWFQGLAAGAFHRCWEAQIKTISRICHENLRGEEWEQLRGSHIMAVKQLWQPGFVHRSVTPVVLCHTGPWECPVLHCSTSCHCCHHHPLWSCINAEGTAKATAKPCTDPDKKN